MIRAMRLAVLLFVVSLFGGPVWAAELFIYPTKGQSPEQQSRDRYECHAWAVQQTGFDPTNPQVASAPPPQRAAPQGGVIRGAGRGAAIGAVGGAIGGDAGKGAAIGAATGALFGGMRRRQQRASEAQAQANWQAQQQAALAGAGSAYNRAMSACLAGRGYTVK